MKTLRLKKDAERRIKAGHLWIFSNDIDATHSPLKNYVPGELIRIETAFEKSIALGYINPHCLLCIRILTLDLQDKIDTAFFIKKISQAKIKREQLFSEKYYRVVFGESDRLPGVVIDQFNDVVVIQINTAGMENVKSFLIDAVKQVFHPKYIVLKCDSSERKMEGLSDYVEVIGDTPPNEIEVIENDCRFYISLIEGQKTGWFFDHRFNRQRIASYCHQKRVLDVFSYCGAFSIPCAKNAIEVIAIDRSASALEKLQTNATLNRLNNISTLCGDALALMHSLQKQKKLFDVVILDPPALIKRKKDIPAGEKMYQKLNEAALQLLNRNGILFSASCSMHLSSANLLNAIRKAGIHTQKELSIIEQCHQGPDHPIHPAIPETQYLKGFIVSLS
ncbi:MAG: RlmI/RlmK family 23S rRNA methyltransferase [Gammaproteobacteria bacterium CG_4_10_14_0_8_um_filter_38_16]|nr:MAG: RlmI/RlmK family 23S rRNA methyltransferase [Gammaproteobacteria bacterium CG_4_10_14_0_8_um_filter_38_16]PJA03306.1 MAG: RlmI/RlmK family 23S rRNA methyltransferase [Gammaproteobacteria bacterium CG_4_10_14_0_2_um_filter_38_22]PJB10351.1 MAG: RlmI/RlmK family 23S rRNA methyltransferase [Gammaproteobacteria bacterium CG_4_9_14_3_um_filter_38_9]